MRLIRVALLLVWCVVQEMPNLRNGRILKLTKELIESSARGAKKRRQETLGAGITRAAAAAKKAYVGPSTPPKTPLIDLTGRDGKRPTKNDPPTCLDFGVDRKLLYPGARFCSNCDFYENQLRAGETGKIKRTSQVFNCGAKHKNFVFPRLEDMCLPVARRQSAKPNYQHDDESSCHSSDLESTLPCTDDDCSCGGSFDDDDDSSDDESQISPSNPDQEVVSPASSGTSSSLPSRATLDSKPAAVPTSSLRQQEVPDNHEERNTMTEAVETVETHLSEVEIMKNKLFAATESLKQANKRIIRLKRERKKLKERSDLNSNTSLKSATATVKRFLNAQVKKKNRKTGKVMAAFVKELTKSDADLEPSVLEALKEVLAKEGRKQMKKDNFSPPEMVRFLDLVGGKINLQAIDLLRTITTKGKKFSQDSMFPSSSQIQRAQHIVEKYGLTQINMKKGVCEGGGEFIEFKADELLCTVIEAFGLTEVAKHRPVRINLSIDGAQISKRIVHCTMGIKVADTAARCPFSGRSLFLSAENQIVQSRNLCIPVKMVMKPETKAIYSEFRDIFHQFLKMSDSWDPEENGPRPPNKLIDELGLCPVRLALNMDLSAVSFCILVGHINEMSCVLPWFSPDCTDLEAIWNRGRS
jgi:hypothetical protein